MSSAWALVDAPDPRSVADETTGAMADFLLFGLSAR